MKKRIRVKDRKGRIVERVINYIPGRYIFAVILSIIETLSVLAIVVIITMYLPYFWIAGIITQVCVIISIICSNHNPDYKVPWLLVVMLLPVVGFMLYFLFYRRKLSKRYTKKINSISNSLTYDDNNALNELSKIDKLFYSDVIHLKTISNTHIYNNTNIFLFQ